MASKVYFTLIPTLDLSLLRLKCIFEVVRIFGGGMYYLAGLEGTKGLVTWRSNFYFTLFFSKFASSLLHFESSDLPGRSNTRSIQISLLSRCNPLNRIRTDINIHCPSSLSKTVILILIFPVEDPYQGWKFCSTTASHGSVQGFYLGANSTRVSRDLWSGCDSGAARGLLRRSLS
jgi:hypothetical protein